MRLADLQDRRIGVVGLGREGRAIVRLISDRLGPHDITAFDESAAATDLDVRLVTGPLADAPLKRCEVLILSPGVSIYRAELRRVLARGDVAVTTATNLWFAEPRSASVVAVTGTKGKSTVCELTAYLARAAGSAAATGGNIGTALPELWDRTADLFVIEVSSYQAALFEGCPDVAVLTNLYPEHLDWHGSLDRYYDDKLRVVRAARTRVVNVANPAAAEATRSLRRIVANDSGGWSVRDGALARDGRTLVPEWSLRGRHNLANLAVALTTVENLGMDWKPGFDALAGFRPLPHRQEPLGESSGRLYVDDSIATTPFATIAALEAFGQRPVAVIVGGYDRGLDWLPFARWVAEHPVAGVVVCGANRDRVVSAVRAGAPDQHLAVTDRLAEAVRHAESCLPDGGVVLLSPGAPSYGEYRDFRDRGRAFARLVPA